MPFLPDDLRRDYEDHIHRAEASAVDDYFKRRFAKPADEEEDDAEEPAGTGAGAAPAGQGSDKPGAGDTGEGGGGEAPGGAPTASGGNVSRGTLERAEGKTGEVKDRDLIGAAVKDFFKGTKESAPQAVGGFLDAMENTIDAVEDLPDFLRPSQLFGLAPVKMGEEGERVLPEIDPADSATGGFIRATSQFLTGFFPAMRAVKGISAGSRALQAMEAGALADLVIWDPHEQRLATYLNQVPSLNAVVPDYLADNNPANESDWEGRLKNAVEGVGLGLAAEGLFSIFRYYKSARAATAATRRAAMTPTDLGVEAAKTAEREAAKADIVNPLPEDALDGLGDPGGDFYITSTAPTVDAHMKTKRAAEARLLEAEERTARVGGLDRILAAVKSRADQQALLGDMPADPLGSFIDMARFGPPGKAPVDKLGKYPLLGFIKQKGGVKPGSPLAQELAKMGVTSKTLVGLFRKDGRGAFDNIDTNEAEWVDLVDPSTGYIDQDKFLEAVSEELAGNLRIPPDLQEAQFQFEGLAREADRFRRELEGLGVDLDTMDNAAVKARLDQIEAERGLLAAMDEAPRASSEAEFQGLEADENVAPPVGREAGEAGAEAEPKIFINHARINTPEDVHALLQQTADADADAINVKRRGVVTNEQTRREAAQEFRNLEDLIGREPGPMSASEAVAARKILTASGEQLLDLAKKASADGATPGDLFAFRRAMQVHYAIQAEVIAARTETARALQSWAIPAGSSKARADQISELLAQGGGRDTATMAKMLGTLANNPTGLNVFVQRSLKGKLRDAMFEAWINGLLISPKTHAVNILSNTLTAFWAIPERMLAAGISHAFYGGEIRMAEAASAAYGLAKGFRDGVILAARAGNDPTVADLFQNFSKQERPYGVAISAEAFDINKNSPLGFAIDIMGRAIRVPGAALDFEDKFFKAVNYRAEIQALAYRQASSEGLEGRQLADRVASIVADPPDAIKAEAIDRAHVNTFTKKLGPMGQAGTRFVNMVPGLRLVLPFIRTPVNILKFAFLRTPLAPLAASVRADIAAGGARAAQAWARVGLGSMVMLTIADMTSDGILTGAGPENKDERAAKMGTGWKPYSVRIGDRYYQYNRLEPVGMLFGMSADIAEILGHVEDEEASKVVAAGAVAFAQNFASKTWAQGIFDVISAIDPNNPVGDPGRLLQDFAGSTIPFSALSRNLAQVIDPTLREPRSTGDDPFAQEYLGGLPKPVAEFLQATINQYRRAIPGLSEELPARHDLFGRPITTDTGLGWVYDFLSPVGGRAANDDPVDAMMVENRIRVAMPERSIKGVRLTGEEYQAYVEMAGQPAKEYLDKMVGGASFKRLSGGPDGMQATITKQVISKFRQNAANQMFARFPQIRARWLELEQRKRTSLVGDR